MISMSRPTSKPLFESRGQEIEVQPAMMESAIAVDGSKGVARAVKFSDVRKGDQIVVGHQGIRVSPVQRATSHTDPVSIY